MEKFLTSIITSLIATPIVAWEFMLAIGIAHLHWSPAIPVIGYPTALLISFLMFSMLTGGTLSASAGRDKR